MPQILHEVEPLLFAEEAQAPEFDGCGDSLAQGCHRGRSESKCSLPVVWKVQASKVDAYAKMLSTM